MPCAAGVCSVATFYKSFSCCTPFDDVRHNRQSDTIETMFADTPGISKAGPMGMITAFFLLIVALLTIPIVVMRLVGKRAWSVTSGLNKPTYSENTDPHLKSLTVSLWLPEGDV